MTPALMIGIVSALLVLTVVVLTARGGSKVAGCDGKRAQVRSMREVDDDGGGWS